MNGWLVYKKEGEGEDVPLYVITCGGGGRLVIKRWGEGGDVPLSLSSCIVTCGGVGISNEK
jgi:hypothetical protein